MDNKSKIEETKKNLLETFPEHEKIKKDAMSKILDKVFSELKTYRDVSWYIRQYATELYPRPEGNYDKEKHPKYTKWYEYFYGVRNEDYTHTDSQFYLWLRQVEGTFLNTFGQRRTYKEACELTAKKWGELIFGKHIQDNGDYSVQGMATAFWGTQVANMYKSKLDNGVAEKAVKLIQEYYEHDCEFMFDGGKVHVELSCDYGPNKPLHVLLVKAGVDAKDTGCICPWKTRIFIDKKDNTVVLCGYQKNTHL